MKIKLIAMLLLISSASQAQESYCGRIDRLKNFPHLDDGQFKLYVQEKKPVERILISKYKRELYLINDDVVLKTYKVAFGQDPLGGPKHFEGDQKTPEGIYSIDYKNPQSAYYLSLHVSYPNDQDRAYAKARGKSPGGDIMVHGLPINPAKHDRAAEWHPNDWTDGCIALKDDEIHDVYSLVKEGTVIEICKPTDK